jgi:hypothetical protein
LWSAGWICNIWQQLYTFWLEKRTCWLPMTEIYPIDD